MPQGQKEVGWDWEALFVVWTEEGLDPDLFWRVTPRVFTMTMQGRRNASFAAENARRRQAWIGEVLARKKRLPRMETLMVDPNAGDLPEQSAEDMVAVLQAYKDAGAEMSIKFIPYGEEPEKEA